MFCRAARFSARRRGHDETTDLRQKMKYSRVDVWNAGGSAFGVAAGEKSPRRIPMKRLQDGF
jgi:hypothetical protein